MKDLVTAAILALAAATALTGAPAFAQQDAPGRDGGQGGCGALRRRPAVRAAADAQHRPGATLTYDYLRRSGISKGPFGPPLNDAITLKLQPGKNPDERNIDVQMFSGQNRFPAGPFRRTCPATP